jgi:hypothetical protein
MFKILLLRSGAGYLILALSRRFGSGCRFAASADLPLADETPDHASIRRFHQTIRKLALSAALLSETNRPLDALGLIAQRDTLGKNRPALRAGVAH